MSLLSIDLETRSECDISESGVYRYATHPSTEVILFGYAYGEDEVRVWDCLRESMPEELREGLLNPFQGLSAWNSSFERLCISNILKIPLEIERFDDTQIFARYLSLPASLEKAGEVLDIGECKKLKEGKELIQI